MKINVFLTLAVVYFISESSFSQCINSSAVADVTLQCSNGIVLGTLNRTGVAFNPNQNLYYSVNAGSSGYPIETFAVTGGAALSTTTQGADYRGLWWNSNNNSLEGNTFSNGGLVVKTLAPITFYATNAITPLGPNTMPNAQSQGHADIANNLVLCYDNGNLYKYNRTTGALIATIPITGLPTAIGNINSYGVAYSGITGYEALIYNYVNRCVYFINYTTGAYVATCTLPITAPNPNTFRTGFANNRFWLYDMNTLQWYGYPLVNSANGPTVTIAANSTSICSGSSVSLTASGANSYVWNTGANTASVLLSPLTNTVYSVVGTATNGCNSTKTIAITVNPGTSVTPVASPSVICSGSSATINASGSSSYTWTPGGSNATSITVSPTSNTSYTVEGTSAFGCVSQAVLTVSVVAGLPVLSLTNTANAGGICPTKTVTLTAAGATTYTWTGGSVPVTNGVSFAPTVASTYIVTGENACGTTTAATSVSVHPLPTVNPVANTSTLCSGSTLSLTATGNATSYVWSGGSVPITNGVGFIPPVSNITYSVVGTSALSCTAMATTPVTVYATPALAPTASPSLICIGNSAVLMAQGAVTYTWASSSQTVNTPNFTVTPAAPGISTYTITKANSSCSDTKIISVTTNSLPTIFALALPNQVCALQPATLSVAGGQSYTWTAPGTPTYNFNGANPIVYPQVSSLYTVAASDGTCTNVTTLSLTVDPNPTVTVSSSSPSVCVGQSVTISAFGGNTYTWTTPSGTLSSQSITVTPTAATAYTVTGDNSVNCTASANQVILVYPTPTITVTVSKPTVCSGSVSILTASGAQSYTWDPGAGSALNPTVSVTPVNLVSGPVIYTVAGSFNNTGCSSSQTAQVSVFVPTLSITGNTNTCYGGNIALTANGGNFGSYNWNTGSSNYSGTNLTTTLAAAAVYTLSATTTSFNITCPASKTVSVDVFFNPTITATAQRTLICKNEQVDIQAFGGVSYSWSNAMNGATITVSPLSNTNYTVTGTDANNCVSTGVVQVKVSNCTGINELSNAGSSFLVYPNPNEGAFTIQTVSAIELKLVDELGQTVRIISLSGSNNYQIYLKDLAKGVYLLSGQSDNLKVNQKVIVTK